MDDQTKRKRTQRMDAGQGKAAQLSTWKERYHRALAAFGDARESFRLCQAQFDGDKRIAGGTEASSVYNFTRELIEAQIDSSVPQPSVVPRVPNEQNRALADVITAAIRNELDRLPFEQMNDLDERVARIMGGSAYLTEWDNNRGMHDTVGELAVRLVTPMELVPQEAVYDTDRMDYFFLAFDETKERLRKKYGKDVRDEGLDSLISDRAQGTAEELCTQVVCFYKDAGSIACISWAGDTLLLEEGNYFARKDKLCAHCGKTQAPDEKICLCGASDWQRRDRDFEVLTQDIVRADGSVIPALSPKREGGRLVMESYEEPLVQGGFVQMERVLQGGMVMGEQPIMQTRQRPVMEPTKLPYYKPPDFPIAVRRNVSVNQRFFGESDCAVVREQQIQANKAMTKIDRKIRATAEFFTKPDSLKFSISNEDVRVLNVKTPEEISMIKAISLDFSAQEEYLVIERAYYQAKSLLAVSDSFQGKEDRSADSARAKELQIAQAAGIQKSKRTMKNAAYADLFRTMFHFLLAFADEPRRYTGTDENGQEIERVFSRYDFLKQDAFGNWYYDDAFIFSADEGGAMQNDERFLMEDIRTDFSMGAFGAQGEPESMLLYWKEKAVLGYPNAKRMVKHWEGKVMQAAQFAEMQMQQMQQMQAAGMAQGQGMPVEGGEEDGRTMQNLRPFDGY